jgi:hypothetical protein
LPPLQKITNRVETLFLKADPQQNTQ